MKDHIQKLADRAKKSVPHGLSPDKWIEVYNEKFAELIVGECRDMFVVNSPSWNLLNEKLEHFGVEE